jgi:hypothetical protein
MLWRSDSMQRVPKCVNYQAKQKDLYVGNEISTVF